MARSLWKGPFITTHIARVINRGIKKGFPTWSRRSVVLPNLVDRTVRVHNGRRLSLLIVTPEQVGYKLGSFSITKFIGNTIHRFNRAAVKKKKADELLRQRKARKQRVKSKAKKGVKKGGNKKSKK